MVDKINDGGSAFPAAGQVGPEHYGFEPGMTLRDWFAGQALAGLLAACPTDGGERGIAHDAYLYADAMLAARERGR